MFPDEHATRGPLGIRGIPVPDQNGTRKAAVGPGNELLHNLGRGRSQYQKKEDNPEHCRLEESVLRTELKVDVAKSFG